MGRYIYHTYVNDNAEDRTYDDSESDMVEINLLTEKRRKRSENSGTSLYYCCENPEENFCDIHMCVDDIGDDKK